MQNKVHCDGRTADVGIISSLMLFHWSRRRLSPSCSECSCSSCCPDQGWRRTCWGSPRLTWRGLTSSPGGRLRTQAWWAWCPQLASQLRTWSPATSREEETPETLTIWWHIPRIISPSRFHPQAVFFVSKQTQIWPQWWKWTSHRAAQWTLRPG